MQAVGKSKVTKLKAKADHVYPLIRLPKAYTDVIGQTAEIFESWHGNRRALFVAFDGATVPPKVIQPSTKVIQPDIEERINTRLRELESQISELKSLFLSNESAIIHEIKKEAPESGFEPQSEPRQGSSEAKLP